MKVPDKSNSQRIIETLLMFAPAPIRAIASSPLGSRIIMTLGAGLLATGAMSVDWKNGIPQLQFHKDKNCPLNPSDPAEEKRGVEMGGRGVS